MRTFLLVLFLAGLGSISIHAQKVEVLTFEEFEAHMAAAEKPVTVYNFWATWCKPCVEEMPYFQQLYIDYKDKGVHLVFVSLDFMSSYERSLLPFVKKENLKGELLLLNAPDYNAWIDKVSPQWSGAIPATLILDKDSGKSYFYERSFNYKELEDIVKPLLK